MAHSRVGAIINARSSSHPHFRSLLEEGLWGFPLDKKGVNRSRWERLEAGAPVLLYFEHRGVRGVWAVCEVVGRQESKLPVKYWVENPAGYPLYVKVRFLLPREHAPSPGNPFRLEWLEGVKPITREELASAFGLTFLKAPQDRWSLFVFGETREKGVTYQLAKLKALLDEFEARNRLQPSPQALSHSEVVELLYRIGQIQGRFPEKEFPLEDKRVDVVWRRVPRGAPSYAFEVSIGGDLYADLVKLKHAHDLWNAIAVLVTTPERAEEARKWISGTFHEAKEYFRVITIDELRQFYEAKRRYKEMEFQLGLS